ncbi:gastric triacylglycerol lipase-like [Symsagittifera roscoffensis]|uniref:gastric triacylglycerol lipase-like n=1 Tax=Symsagittifera roscoffensis TaxID=84072 RepID=UPI00307B1C96
MEIATSYALLFAVYQSVSYGHDPDVWKDACQLITSKGYPCEEHQVTTEDGYILTMHRIPHGHPTPEHPTTIPTENRSAVVLMHCLECDATIFITNFPDQSLGFILADAGYDVWLPNARGSKYSRTHTSLKQTQFAFWEWTWDEIAYYDLPAVVDYVTQFVNQTQINYVGYSQGTMIGFAGFSYNSHLAAKVKFFGALAPVAQLGGVTSVIRYFTGLVEKLQWVYRLLGYGLFFPPTKLMNLAEAQICSNVDILFKPACTEVYYLVAGQEDTRQLNTSRLDVYFSHTPSGTSTLNVNHYAQQVDSGVFQAYDWGSRHKNNKHYGTPTPPVYNAWNVTIPTALFHGKQDALADPLDVAWLEKELGHVVFSRQYDQFNHLDFAWGLDCRYSVYPDLLSQLAQYN